MKKLIEAMRRSGSLEVLAGIVAGLLFATGGGFVYHQYEKQHGADQARSPSAVTGAVRTVPKPPHFAVLGHARVSPSAKYIADWVADSGDSAGMPFVIIDKPSASVHVFDASARWLGSSPVLLGSALGDDSAPGIGDLPLSAVKPEEKTTPAGRFLGERGHNARGEDVVWIDYDAAVSMHRVLTTNPVEHRLERLATPTIADNRVSYGCVNVPVPFYEKFLRPAFAQSRGVIYVLPDTRPLAQVFSGAYDVAARARRQSVAGAP